MVATGGLLSTVQVNVVVFWFPAGSAAFMASECLPSASPDAANVPPEQSAGAEPSSWHVTCPAVARSGWNAKSAEEEDVNPPAFTGDRSTVMVGPVWATRNKDWAAGSLMVPSDATACTRKSHTPSASGPYEAPLIGHGCQLGPAPQACSEQRNVTPVA